MNPNQLSHVPRNDPGIDDDVERVQLTRNASDDGYARRDKLHVATIALDRAGRDDTVTFHNRSLRRPRIDAYASCSILNCDIERARLQLA